MTEALGFDLYDDFWRDCWIAATAVSRLRKRQADVDIQNRVTKLLQDFGPQSTKPLSLRIYGTLIKGFCVISNERARSLYSDCERMVLMFARQPFAATDNTIRLPAAKRPRMEAALTLDLDLARVEASEAFDWTQAPLEEGSLLRLGSGGHGVQLLPDEALLLPPASQGFDFAGVAFPGEPGVGSADFNAGWLPRLDVGLDGAAGANMGSGFFGNVQSGEKSETGPRDATGELIHEAASQLVIAEVAPQQELGFNQQQLPQELDVPPPTRILTRRRRQDMLLRPGAVYGFDNEMSMPSDGYELWQADSRELTKPRKRPREYGEEMSDALEQIEHLGPRLRIIVDPPVSASLLGSCRDKNMDAAFGGAWPSHVAAVDTMVQGPVGLLDPSHGLAAPAEGEAQAWQAAGQADVMAGTCNFDFADVDGRGGGLAEAQDDRTAEVGQIIRACLKNSNPPIAMFHDMVPPGVAERTTAACTFSAVLALASAGEFRVSQEGPYGAITISLA